MVTIEKLADTLRKYPNCNCHKLGLLPGIYVADLWMLGGGCTMSQPDGKPGWVCPRLDAVRRYYKPWELLQTGEDPRPPPLKPQGKVSRRRRAQKKQTRRR